MFTQKAWTELIGKAGYAKYLGAHKESPAFFMCTLGYLRACIIGKLQSLIESE